MPIKGKYLHVRYSKKELSHDDRESWSLSDINIGNRLHHINESYRSDTSKQRSLVDRKNDSFPYIKIYEMQPDNFRNFEQYLEVIKKQFTSTLQHVALLGGHAIEKHFPKMLAAIKAVGGGGDLDKMLQTYEKESSTAKTSSQNQDYNNYKASLLRDLLVTREDYDKQIYKKPIEEDYNSFFNGRYIRSYELPYSENTYLYADGKSGWSTLNSNKINFGNKTLNAMFKAISKLGVADVPLVPNWVSGKDSSNHFKLTSKFYLVNADSNSLIKNFMFLSQLIQGSLWLQNDTFHVPPNVYSVELPGFLFIRYASMFISVKHFGNRRVLDENLFNVLDSTIKDGYKRIYYGSGYEMFKANRLKEDVFFPDAWEIEITFSSLVPNNYNTFMNYLENGINGSSRNIVVGSKMKDGKSVSPEKFDSDGSTSKVNINNKVK